MYRLCSSRTSVERYFITALNQCYIAPLHFKRIAHRLRYLLHRERFWQERDFV